MKAVALSGVFFYVKNTRGDNIQCFNRGDVPYLQPADADGAVTVTTSGFYGTFDKITVEKQ